MSENKVVTAKSNLDIKKLLLDNGIIIVLLILVLLTGILKDNFFSVSNLKNISVNAAARVIIAFGVSGCLITKGTFSRSCCRSCFLYSRNIIANS